MDYIGLVLLHEWDPIGVSNEPNAQDEYDSYVAGVFHLLAAGVSNDELIDHLLEIETDRMGLPGQERSRLAYLVEKLQSFFEEYGR